jgi:hypothetical protein
MKWEGKTFLEKLIAFFAFKAWWKLGEVKSR